MAERHRPLPSWMAKKEEKKKEPLRSQRKRKVARAVFYCMNERELVEAAVSYLSSAACEDVATLTDHQVADKAEDIGVKIREKPVSLKANAKPPMEVLQEEPSDCSDAPGTTCVSETDLDITEVETVPYTRSPQRHGPEDQRSGSVQEHSSVINVETEAEKRQEHPQMKADTVEEDDSLRLVREIFFT